MPERYKVTGGSARWPLLIVLAAAALLAVIIWTGAQPPPAPEVAALSPTPAAPPVASPAASPAFTPAPTSAVASIDGAVVYALQPLETGAFAPQVIAYDRQTQALLMQYGRASALALSDDGQTLVLYDHSSASLRAVDAATGQLRWLQDEFVDPALGARMLSEPVLMLSATQGVLLLQDATALLDNLLVVFDLTSGALQHSITLPGAFAWSDAQFFDAQTLLLLGYGGAVATLDLPSGALTEHHQPDWRSVAWAAEARHLFVLTADSQMLTLDAQFNVLNATQLAQPIYFNDITRLLANASGTRLLLSATLLERVEFVLESDGWLNQWPQPVVLTLDPATGALKLIDGWWASVFSLRAGAFLDEHTAMVLGYGNVLLLIEDGQVAERLLPDLELLQAATLGPRLDFAPLNAAPTPLPEISLSPPTPEPELLQTPAAPLAWVWDTDSFEVTAYQTDGAATLMASNVVQIVERATQPPLLLQALDEHLAVFDPLVGTAQAFDQSLLGLSPEMIPQHSLAPDGQQLALVLLDLADQRSLKLLLLDLQAGSITALTLPETLEVRTVRLLGWDESKLYLAEQNNPGSAFVTALWRFERSTSTWTELWTAPQPALIAFDPASATLLYEPKTRDLGAAELFSLDLNAGTQAGVYQGPWLNAETFSIAPGGNLLVYLRPDGLGSRSGGIHLRDIGRNTYELELAPRTNLCHTCLQLEWSADGALLYIEYQNLLDPDRAIKPHYALVDTAPGTLNPSLSTPVLFFHLEPGSPSGPYVSLRSQPTPALLLLSPDAAEPLVRLTMSYSSQLIYVP